MPTILYHRGYMFAFFSADQGEPIHIHVAKQGKSAKLWIDTWEFAKTGKFRQYELNEIIQIAKDHENEIRKAWNEHFQG